MSTSSNQPEAAAPFEMSAEFKEQAQRRARALRLAKEAGDIISVSLFQARVCRGMVEAIHTHPGWAEARVSRRGPDGIVRSVIDPAHRTASVLYSEHLAAVRPKFDRKMNEALKPLVEQLFGRRLTDHEGTQIVRYAPGGHYIPHSDVGRMTANRHYTVLCYLNDGFEGGGTRFPSFDYTVKPRCGKAILFPSTYLHGGEPVTSGEKYVLISWITGPVSPA